MRADEVRPGFRAPDGTVTKTETVYGDGPDDGITTLWWDDGLITYTKPSHRMGPCDD